MPILPSSSNVQPISPRVASDPGLQTPPQAFESPLGVAAGELAPGFEKLAQVAKRQEDRDDTTDRASKILDANAQIDEEFRRRSTEQDFSDRQVLQEFSTTISKIRQDALQGHQGSPDSKSLLSVRLQAIEAEAIGRAAAFSTSLSREKILKVYDRALTPIVNRAMTNSTRGGLDSALVELETTLSDLKGGLDPKDEEELRSFGREQIALGTLNGMVINGQIDKAESFLEEGGLVNMLNAKSLREVRSRIETVRATRDQTLNEIRQAEVILGRPLHEEEKLVKLGLASKRALTERETRINELVSRGITPPLAQDIASNDIRVIGPDQFGNFYTVNLVNNQRTLVSDQDAEALNGIAEEARANTKKTSPQTPPPEQAPAVEPSKPPTKLEQDLLKGTGVFSAAQAGISNFFGQLIEGAVFQDTTDARQAVRTFTQTAKTTFVNNPKFPVEEQKIVANLLPNVDTWLVDPDRARSDMQELKLYLNNSKKTKESELARGKMTTRRRGKLTDQISSIDELLSLMEVTGKSEDKGLSVSTQEEVDKLKPGTRFIWGPTKEEFIKE